MAEVEQKFHEIDKDKNGSVDLKEYYRYMKGRDGTILKTNLLYRALFQLSLIRKEFHRFDVDGSGYITKDELVQIIKDRTGSELSEEQLKLMMKDVDENGDNKFNYEEFVTLMTKSSRQKSCLLGTYLV